MGELLRFEDAVNKRLASRMVKEIGGWYKNSADTVNEYYRLLQDNPALGIKQLPKFIERARNSAGPGTRAWEAFTGGANHDWTGPLLDVTGIIYTLLPQEVRKEALENVLKFLDGQNYFAAQNNVEMINEPWLVADIIINRGLYWCGYQEYVDLLTQNPEWTNLYPHLDNVKSAFWMAFAVVQPRFAEENIRENFYKMFPSLTERTQDAIAARTAIKAQNAFLRTATPIQETVEATLFKYDPRFHTSIKKKIEERKWVDLNDPVRVVWGEGLHEREYRYRSELDTYDPRELAAKADIR